MPIVRTSRKDVDLAKWRGLIQAGSPDPALQCTSPLVLQLDGAPDPVLVGFARETARKSLLDLPVRCRKCSGCLRHRSRLWAARAIDETALSSRSWFGTLTLHPQQAFRFEMLAARSLQKSRREPWSDINSSDRFKAIAKEVGPDLQRWLKRVRNASSARFRYLLVCEAHKSGVPHWHLLLHEGTGTVPKRVLDSAWRLGFSQFRLVQDQRAATYVCKYLAKSALTRVRASANYGKGRSLRSGGIGNEPPSPNEEQGRTMPCQRRGEVNEKTGVSPPFLCFPVDL